MSASANPGAPRTEKSGKADERLRRNEKRADKRDKEPIEPLDERSLDAVLRECPL